MLVFVQYCRLNAIYTAELPFCFGSSLCMGYATVSPQWNTKPHVPVTKSNLRMVWSSLSSLDPKQVHQLIIQVVIKLSHCLKELPSVNTITQSWTPKIQAHESKEKHYYIIHVHITILIVLCLRYLKRAYWHATESSRFVRGTYFLSPFHEVVYDSQNVLTVIIEFLSSVFGSCANKCHAFWPTCVCT